MFGSVGSYLMAAFGMAFAGTSALTLIYAVGHLDPPETPPASDSEARGRRIVTVVPPEAGQSMRIAP
jgi:hypothetical protein